MKFSGQYENVYKILLRYKRETNSSGQLIFFFLLPGEEIWHFSDWMGFRKYSGHIFTKHHLLLYLIMTNWGIKLFHSIVLNTKDLQLEVY